MIVKMASGSSSGAKMAGGTARWCIVRMGDAAVAVRSLPFRIGPGWDAEMVVGSGVSCSILLQRTSEGLELLAERDRPVVNGEALGEGRRRTLSNGDVVAIGGGLQFAVENITVEDDGHQSSGTGEAARSGEAGASQALEQAMEKALECIICHETVFPEPS